MLAGAVFRLIQKAYCWEGLVLVKICHRYYAFLMSTMNISLPESLKSFVDEQVQERGYGTSSEYVRELIRKDQDRLALRELLLEGAASSPGPQTGSSYFEGLRKRVHKADKANAKAGNKN